MEEFYPSIRVACLKNGVSVSVRNWQHHPDCAIGEVGKLSKHDKVELVVRISPLGRGNLWVAFEGRGQGPVVKKKNRAEVDGEKGFSKGIRIHKDPSSAQPPFTRYPENHFRILQVRGAYLRHFEVALIAQRGRFYVVKQLTRQGSLYGDGEIIFPPFFEWPEITDFLTELAGTRGVKKVETYTPPPPPASNGLGNFQGRVLWWNMAQQFGAIQLRNGSAARVHRSKLERQGSRLAYLVTGEIVDFEMLQIPKQTTDRTSTFQQEAAGVRLA